MRTLFSSRIRGHLWGYCACNVVSLHYVPHQNLGRHRYPSRSLRRYSVSDARKTDSAYLCQRPFRPGVPALSSRRGHRIGRCLLHRMSQQLGTSRTSRDVRLESAKWAKADIDQVAVTNRNVMSTRPSLDGIHIGASRKQGHHDDFDIEQERPIIYVV